VQSRVWSIVQIKSAEQIIEPSTGGTEYRVQSTVAGVPQIKVNAITNKYGRLII
jgi:hypothetical protein